VSPVKYELGFYIPEEDILHSHRRENLKSYDSYFRSNEMRASWFCKLLTRIYSRNCFVWGLCPQSAMRKRTDIVWNGK
jgi:hypothetical protein